MPGSHIPAKLDGISLETRISLRLDTARDLALAGAEPVARSLCASIFLRHALLLAGNDELQSKLVQCLLLLQMTGLLSRLLRAIHGTEVTFSVLAEPGPSRLLVNFSNGPALVMRSLTVDGDPLERLQSAERWSAAIIQAADAGADPLPALLPSAELAMADREVESTA